MSKRPSYLSAIVEAAKPDVARIFGNFYRLSATVLLLYSLFFEDSKAMLVVNLVLIFALLIVATLVEIRDAIERQPKIMINQIFEQAEKVTTEGADS